MEELEKLNTYVNQYYKMDLRKGAELNILLQKLTGLLFYLETLRSEIHDLYESEVFNSVKDGSSVSRAVNEANVSHPEMYRLRRVMDAGYKVADAIRTNISFLKNEMSNIKTH